MADEVSGLERLALPNALVVAEAAVRLGSFTEAARELNIAQSAVSRHVTNVETRSGLRFFERHGNRLVATREGIEFARAVREGLGLIQRTIERLRTKPDGIFLLGCSSDVAQGFVMPRFDLIMSHLTGGQLRLLTSFDYRDFDASETDLSIRFGNADEWPELKVVPLIPGEWFPVCAPALWGRVAGLAAAEPEFRQLPLLHLGLGEPGEDSWERWTGIAERLEGPRFTTYASLMYAAIAGHGVALAWRGFVEGHLAKGELVRAGGASRTSRGGFHLVMRRRPADIVARVARVLCDSVDR